MHRGEDQAHLDKLNDPRSTDYPVYWAARHDNLPAIKALAESGVDIIKLCQQRRNYKGKVPLCTPPLIVTVRRC